MSTRNLKLPKVSASKTKTLSAIAVKIDKETGKLDCYTVFIFSVIKTLKLVEEITYERNDAIKLSKSFCDAPTHALQGCNEKIRKETMESKNMSSTLNALKVLLSRTESHRTCSFRTEGKPSPWMESSQIFILLVNDEQKHISALETKFGDETTCAKCFLADLNGNFHSN